MELTSPEGSVGDPREIGHNTEGGREQCVHFHVPPVQHFHVPFMAQVFPCYRGFYAVVISIR